MSHVEKDGPWFHGMPRHGVAASGGVVVEAACTVTVRQSSGTVRFTHDTLNVLVAAEASFTAVHSGVSVNVSRSAVKGDGWAKMLVFGAVDNALFVLARG